MRRKGIYVLSSITDFCTDNAAWMIGVAAYYEYMKGTRHGWDLNAVPNLKLGEVEYTDIRYVLMKEKISGNRFCSRNRGKRMHSKV